MNFGEAKKNQNFPLDTGSLLIEDDRFVSSVEQPCFSKARQTTKRSPRGGPRRNLALQIKHLRTCSLEGDGLSHRVEKVQFGTVISRQTSQSSGGYGFKPFQP